MADLCAIGLTRRHSADFFLAPASLALRGGLVHVLVGPNGAGKSTLLHLLSGLDKADSGQLQIDGNEADRLTPIQRAQLIGYLPQRIQLAWPIGVADMVALGRHAHGDRDVARYPALRHRVEQALSAVGALHLIDRSTADLSGGELALAALARVLVADTPLLLLDEPTAALDPKRQLAVMHHLQTLARGGRTIVIVLHDLNLAAQFADRLVWMERGRITAQTPGDADSVTRQVKALFGVEPDIRVDANGRICSLALPASGVVVEEPAIG